jgi:hypothetical protein
MGSVEDLFPPEIVKLGMEAGTVVATLSARETFRWSLRRRSAPAVWFRRMKDFGQTKVQVRLFRQRARFRN